MTEYLIWPTKGYQSNCKSSLGSKNLIGISIARVENNIIDDSIAKTVDKDIARCYNQTFAFIDKREQSNAQIGFMVKNRPSLISKIREKLQFKLARAA